MITRQSHSLNSLYSIFETIQNISNRIQNFYNRSIRHLDFYNSICTCGSSDWCRYGHYSRYLIICETKYLISVQRVRCNVCGATHALLPSFITPHIQYSTFDIIDILLDYNEEFPLIIHSHKAIISTFDFIFSSIKPKIISSLDFFSLPNNEIYSFLSTSKRHRNFLNPPT